MDLMSQTIDANYMLLSKQAKITFIMYNLHSTFLNHGLMNFILNFAIPK